MTRRSDPDQPSVWDLMAAARRYRAGGTGPKATLLAVMEHMGLHDGEWSCWPGTPLLAHATEQVEGTVRRHLAAFETAGLLKRRPEGRVGGGRNANRLVLNVAVLLGETAHDARIAEGAIRAQDPDQSAHTPDAAPYIEPKNPSNPSAGASAPEPPSKPKREPRWSPDAREVVTAWMDERKAADNPVGIPYPQCAQVVHSMLVAGVKRSRVEWALRNSPTCSTRALEMAIQRRLAAEAAPATNGHRAAAQEAMDLHQQMYAEYRAKEQSDAGE